MLHTVNLIPAKSNGPSSRTSKFPFCKFLALVAVCCPNCGLSWLVQKLERPQCVTWGDLNRARHDAMSRSLVLTCRSVAAKPRKDTASMMPLRGVRISN
eukprot:2219332-Amphidinium_carterae.1